MVIVAGVVVVVVANEVKARGAVGVRKPGTGGERKTEKRQV